jgi:16S rRNA (adenine1518-N6/adenine1519-N6)-dimethyltransferase
VSDGIIRKIVDAIAPRDGDTVVEIGPGLGALTEPLLERIAHLHVVEIDRDLIARLRQRFPPERLSIHEGDALEFDFGSLKGAGRLKIVGNLPYNISSPLLFHLVPFARWSMTCTSCCRRKSWIAWSPSPAARISAGSR